MIGKGQYNIPQCQNRMTTEERKEARRRDIYTYKRSHVIRRQQSWKNQQSGALFFSPILTGRLSNPFLTSPDPGRVFIFPFQLFVLCGCIRDRRVSRDVEINGRWAIEGVRAPYTTQCESSWSSIDVDAGRSMSQPTLDTCRYVVVRSRLWTLRFFGPQGCSLLINGSGVLRVSRVIHGSFMGHSRVSQVIYGNITHFGSIKNTTTNKIQLTTLNHYLRNPIPIDIKLILVISNQLW